MKNPNKLTYLAKRLRPLVVGVAEGTCRVIAQATGWYISAGTVKRYFEHGKDTVASFDSASDHTIHANAEYNFVHGYNNTVDGTASNNYVLGDNHNIDDNDYSLIFGDGVSSPSEAGGTMDAALRFGQRYAATGDAQQSIFHTRNQAVVTSSWQSFSQFNVPVDSVWYFHAKIVIIGSGVARAEVFTVEGAIENDGGTTTLLASTTTNIYRDTATAECQAIGDDTGDDLEFQLRETGGNNYTYRMVFRVDTVEVNYP